jgi:hypothetical protein
VDVAQWIVLGPPEGLLVAAVSGAGFALLVNRANNWWIMGTDRLVAHLNERRNKKP